MNTSDHHWNAAVQWFEWRNRRNKSEDVKRAYEKFHWLALLQWAKLESEQRSIVEEKRHDDVGEQ